ncbi:MFS transporter [Pedococcus aerophilus]|uniref:MFS transporter n=1 Tax=Pedococcus aerophilus TaxID=436356 RepID=A0ABN3UQX5_9MICO
MTDSTRRPGPRPDRAAPATDSFSLRAIAVPAFGPTVLAAVGQGAVLPVMVLRARELGASVTVAAGMVALVGFAQLLAALPAGAIVSRIGETRALMGAALVEVAAMLAGAFAPNLWVFALATAAVGLEAAVFNLARQAYLTDAVPLGMRARALSTLGGVNRIGLFVGPFLGALAVHQGGIRAAYLVAAVGAFAAFLLVAFGPDLTATHEASMVERSGASVWSVLGSHRRTLLALGSGVLVIAGARACRTSVLPLYAESIGISASDTALVFGIAGAVDMLLFYPAGLVMDRWGRAWIAVPTVLVLGVGMMLLPLTASIVPLTAVAMVMAFGNGIGSGIVMTLGADAAPPEARPQFLGGWRLMADLGGTAGPLLVGAIALVAPLAAAIVTVGALSILGGGWLAYWVPRFDPVRRRA